ncbi:EamA family transporter [Spirochaetota bacterium]
MKKNLPSIILAYLAVYIIWGSTYLAISWSVETIPPYYIVGFRFFVSGLAFLAIAAAKGGFKLRPGKREYVSAAFLAVFLLLGGNGFISIGERTVDSYIAAIIISSTPFCVAFFNRIFFREKISLPRLGGMIFGLLGVAILLYDGQKSRFVFSLDMLFIILGFLNWGFGTSLSKASYFKVHPDNYVNSGIEWTMAGVAALVISGFVYKPLPSLLPTVSVKSWLGLAYLSSIGALGLAAYNYLLKHEPTKRLVSYAIVNPIIAVILGIFIGGEAVLPLLIPGISVILAGLVLMLYGDEIWNRIHRKKPDYPSSGVKDR